MTAGADAEVESVVQAQLEAYNRRDVDAFVACYSAEAALYAWPDTPVAQGTAQLRERYGARFASAPGLHASIEHRIVMAPFAIDHERITGLPGGATVEAVVIYEVRDARIVSARSLSRGIP